MNTICSVHYTICTESKSNCAKYIALIKFNINRQAGFLCIIFLIQFRSLDNLGNGHFATFPAQKRLKSFYQNRSNNSESIIIARHSIVNSWIVFFI